ASASRGCRSGACTQSSSAIVYPRSDSARSVPTISGVGGTSSRTSITTRAGSRRSAAPSRIMSLVKLIQAVVPSVRRSSPRSRTASTIRVDDITSVEAPSAASAPRLDRYRSSCPTTPPLGSKIGCRATKMSFTAFPPHGGGAPGRLHDALLHERDDVLVVERLLQEGHRVPQLGSIGHRPPGHEDEPTPE